jgi:hypothetical protein
MVGGRACCADTLAGGNAAAVPRIRRSKAIRGDFIGYPTDSLIPITA